uniref:Helicase n=1 Tax=viral metagenome TaxID=1070528 RepID=A0A6C0HS73_9ZZZZ
MKLCASDHKTEDITLLDHFDSFPHKLSSFQKYAIEAIVLGKDVLITAHTGSGKTLAAEFAIRHFTSIGKKVIYTSPIKALSNQKFYEFQSKFSDVSIGLLTGDIKMNPLADVLIMTTEILHKKLFNSSRDNFDLNMDEIGCVIFDEVHYINDKERGHVWEETIMNLPKQIQMTMLSATINSPEKFATWCEKRGNEVWLIPTYTRVVPLTHYAFVVSNSQCLKLVKEKDKQLAIKRFANKLHVIKDPAGLFLENTYQEVKNFLTEQKGRITTRHVLNEVSSFMMQNEMLPALCFVLSRKRLELCANGITTNLLEEDSDVPYIEKECESIIRRLANYKEYLGLPEYHETVRLLKKGIAVHHAGVMPVLREMVEILYAKGYVKLLFATETFAVGVNMPTKTVLFTDVHKHDGNNFRVLHPHEYTQMAGRAGRRGIDKVGNVILLYNLFDSEKTSHREMLYGQPAVLKSKFEVSSQLILSLLYNKLDIGEFVKKTMHVYENEICTEGIKMRIKELEDKIGVYDKKILEKYENLVSNIKIHTNRKRKDFQKELADFVLLHPTLETELQKIREKHFVQREIDLLKLQLYDNISYEIDKEIRFLVGKGFVDEMKLTDKGIAASQIHEIEPLILSTLLMNGNLNELTTKELIGIFSCFTDIKVSDPIAEPVNYILELLNNDILVYSNERAFNLNLQYDLMEYAMNWSECETEEDCKGILQKMETDGIFLGDFVKAVLKIVNIAREVEKVGLMFDLVVMEAVSYVPNVMLKYMVNNQSLYII